jgi:hypothetical protein
MDDRKTDFIIQAALLDKYIHLEDLSVDRVGVSVVIKKIKGSPDLLRYFLGQNPSPAWAKLFYENSFFSTPPNVIEVENGFQTPYWGLSAYLKSAAESVPELVKKVVSEIETNNPIIYEDLINALSRLPASDTVVFEKKIKQWLEGKFVYSWGFAEATINLIVLWAKAGFITQAVDLLSLILQPVSSEAKIINDYYLGGEGKPRIDLDYVRPDLWSETIPKLSRLAYAEMLNLLENKLLECLRVEMSAKHVEVDFTSGSSYWWRPAIADSEQNFGADYKDKILVAFRNLLDAGAKEDPNKMRQELTKYLRDSIVILKRVALYVVANNVDSFVDLAWELLKDKEFHSDLKFHNDYFQLLRLSYPHLSQLQQEEILTIIQNGPSEKEKDNSRRFALDSGREVEKYLLDQKNYWIRDRLWVIQQYLTEDVRGELDILCDTYGEPDHPGFLSWSSGGFWIKDVSPKPKEQLLALSPIELLDFIRNWKEDPSEDFGPERISLRGLSEAVAEIILDIPERYGDLFTYLRQALPSISLALFSRAQEKSKKGQSVPWIELISLILSCSESALRLRGEDVENALNARMEGVRLLQHGLTGNDDKKVIIPASLFEDVQQILQIYLEDSHPNFEQDRPQENEIGHRDPLTTSLNSVRPIAFASLMEFIKHTDVKSDWGVSQRSWAKTQLERKLNKNLDSSLAVHSIFGRYYWLLSSWESDWLQNVIPQIFPTEETSDNIDYFLAAWDSYIIYNTPGGKTMSLLRDKYIYCVELLSQGKTTKTHLNVPGRIFSHIFLDYLWNPYDVHDRGGLVNIFMNRCDDAVRSQAVKSLVDFMKHTPEPERDKLWLKIREFWIWRTNEFSLSRYPSEMEKEMEQFSLLATYIPDSEKLEDVQILLNPFILIIKNGFVWRNLEKLLSLRAESESVQVAKIYRLVHEEISTSPTPRHIFYAEEADKIINTIIKNNDSRKDALRIINIIFRNGNERYRKLYEEYS